MQKTGISTSGFAPSAPPHQSELNAEEDDHYEPMSQPYEIINDPYQVLQGPINPNTEYQSVHRASHEPLPEYLEIVSNRSPPSANRPQLPLPNAPSIPAPSQQTQFGQTQNQPMMMPAQQQPVFVQQPAAAPGIGVGGGPVVYYVAQPQQQQQPQVQPDFDYKPNSCLHLSVLTLVICGVFSPLSVVCSIPALIFSLKSKKSYEGGLVKEAKKNGAMAAYLIAGTVIFAMVFATIVTGAAIPKAIANQCGLLTNQTTVSSFDVQRYGSAFVGNCRNI